MYRIFFIDYRICIGIYGTIYDIFVYRIHYSKIDIFGKSIKTKKTKLSIQVRKYNSCMHATKVSKYLDISGVTVLGENFTSYRHRRTVGSKTHEA